MLHELLKDYLDAVEQAILSCDGVYVERYTEEILTPERVNLRLRLRFDKGYLLETHEAVIIKQSETHPTHFGFFQVMARIRFDLARLNAI